MTNFTLNERITIKVKEWLYDREASKASSYNTYFNVVERDAEKGDSIKVENGFIKAFVTVEAETEKAIKVSFDTIEGRNWSAWLPKSQVEAC